MRFSLIQGAMVTSVVLPHAALAAQKTIPFAYNNDIQTGLIAQVPTGVFTPANTLAPAVTFTIPKAKLTAKPPKYNFWNTVNGGALTITLSASKPSYVYTLMNAYSPAIGANIATVAFFGSKGATQSFTLVGGTDIRDFCQNIYANTINGTTTQNAFSVSDVVGACGTGNVTTGFVTDYRVDEQQFALSSAFQKQKLIKIVITPVNGTPILLGVTVVPATN